RYGFRDAEVLCILGNTYFHFLANAEEMIDGIAAGENDRRIIRDLDLLFAEIPGWYPLQADKRMKVQLHIVFSRKLKVWRLFTFGLRLGNQDLFLNPRFRHIRF